MFPYVTTELFMFESVVYTRGEGQLRRMGGSTSCTDSVKVQEAVLLEVSAAENVTVYRPMLFVDAHIPGGEMKVVFNATLSVA